MILSGTCKNSLKKKHANQSKTNKLLNAKTFVALSSTYFMSQLCQIFGFNCTILLLQFHIINGSIF